MSITKQRIMTIDAKRFFRCVFKRPEEKGKLFLFNLTKRTEYRAVVKQEGMMEECPLLHQFLELLSCDDRTNEELLYDKLIIIDFGDIFLPDTREDKDEQIRQKKESFREKARDIIENGLDIRFPEDTVHMVPFDKSGNMSRNGRITFIRDKYLKAMNERLNLGMDFGKIKVVLSKYYAYRGLYLSTSRWVMHEKFEITPDTLIVMKNIRKMTLINGEERSVTGETFERNVLYETAVEKEKNTGDWEFQPIQITEVTNPEIPFDGIGFVTPEYSEYINQSLKLKGATSYQIRLPYAKGMLHSVNVHGFLEEYTKDGIGEDEYWYEDAFGIKRDLKKARIFLTESMFKGQQWLNSYCEENAITDPMQYYCDALRKYNHGLYISGTNLPYGHTRCTHLSYQMINTLALTKDEFGRVADRHCDFLQEPIRFLKEWDEVEVENGQTEEESILYDIPNWKRAVLENDTFSNDIYVKGQLKNLQKGLLTKLATGKLIVEGQTRYLCRDLLPLLAALLTDYRRDISHLYRHYLYQRFYLPVGAEAGESATIKLEENQYCAFFRSPHLSRNEQVLMRPYVDEKEKYLESYHKYFGHLTGIVMLPRGTTAPLCLGGADFDGDLVNIVFDEDIVRAVKRGTYKEENGELVRKLPLIEIPDSGDSNEQYVPEKVPYQHIYDTFSNRIGQISNASISIGQEEYGSEKVSEEYTDTYEPKKATCSKCTLLTGLEIDAAKNGIHPNLDLILNNGIKKNEYITFLSQFKKLKGNFRYEELICKVEKGSSIEIKNKEKETIKFSKPETGTYINDLPILFVENLERMKKSWNSKKKKGKVLHDFRYAQKDLEIWKDKIDEFKQDCNAVLNLHFYYQILLKRLKEEKKKVFYEPENLEKHIRWIYDEEYAEELQEDILPVLRGKIEECISTNASFEEIEKRINLLQWQFQPAEKRGETLEKIIGNGFKESYLSEEEKEFLYHFHQQGYKLLWRLLKVIEGPKTLSFDKVKGERVDADKISDSEKLIFLDCMLEQEARSYYENNEEGIEQKLYQYCLKALRAIIEEANLELATKIAAFYEVAEYKTDMARQRFFWDVFRWDELEPFIGKKE